MKRVIGLVAAAVFMSSTSFAGPIQNEATGLLKKATELEALSQDLKYANGPFQRKKIKADIQLQIKQIEKNLDNLKKELNIPDFGHQDSGLNRPIELSATCQLDVGGNFFTPKSQVDCEVNGKGAVSYEIRVNGSAKWTGPLDPRSKSQLISTNKKKVGGHAFSYVLILKDKSGKSLQRVIHQPRYY